MRTRTQREERDSRESRTERQPGHAIQRIKAGRELGGSMGRKADARKSGFEVIRSCLARALLRWLRGWQSLLVVLFLPRHTRHLSRCPRCCAPLPPCLSLVSPLPLPRHRPSPPISLPLSLPSHLRLARAVGRTIAIATLHSLTATSSAHSLSPPTTSFPPLQPLPHSPPSLYE